MSWYQKGLLLLLNDVSPQPTNNYGHFSFSAAATGPYFMRNKRGDDSVKKYGRSGGADVPRGSSSSAGVAYIN